MSCHHVGHDPSQTSRTSSRASRTLPMARRLAFSACCDDRPSRSRCAALNARWASISSRRSASCRDCRRRYATRRNQVLITIQLGSLEHVLNSTNHAPEFRAFVGELLFARGSQSVVPRAAVGLRGTPLRFRPVVQEQSLEGGI